MPFDAAEIALIFAIAALAVVLIFRVGAFRRLATGQQ